MTAFVRRLLTSRTITRGFALLATAALTAGALIASSAAAGR